MSISSIYLLKRMMLLDRGSKLSQFSSLFFRKMFAYVGAIEVPIAVPLIWRKVFWSKKKKLLFKMLLRRIFSAVVVMGLG